MPIWLTIVDWLTGALFIAAVIGGFGFGIAAMIEFIQMLQASSRTPRANLGVRFLSFWIWLPGMLNDKGLKHRSQYVRLTLGFLACWVFGALLGLTRHLVLPGH